VKASGVSVRSQSFLGDVSPATREREVVEAVRDAMEGYGIHFEGSRYSPDGEVPVDLGGPGRLFNQ
jgi:hypothetical protein